MGEAWAGIDVGGTRLKLGVVGADGSSLRAEEAAIETSGGPEGVRGSLTAACARLRELAGESGVALRGVGIGFPGLVDADDGVLLTSPPQIPGVDGLPLARIVSEALGVPACAENDANAAAWAEAKVGAGKGHGSVLTVTVGTGLGGGLVVGGELVRGGAWTGGEIGHVIYEPRGRGCSYNGRGCLELYASATALVRIHREWGGEADDARAIVEKARAGDGRAAAAISEMAAHLGCGLASAANLIGFEVIAVGGGVCEAGDLLFDPLRAAFAAYAIPALRASTRILKAELGNRAGHVGAALLARHRHA